MPGAAHIGHAIDTRAAIGSRQVAQVRMAAGIDLGEAAGFERGVHQIVADQRDTQESRRQRAIVVRFEKRIGDRLQAVLHDRFRNAPLDVVHAGVGPRELP